MMNEKTFHGGRDTVSSIVEDEVSTPNKPVIRLNESHTQGFLHQLGYLESSTQKLSDLRKNNVDRFEAIARKFPQLLEINGEFGMEVNREMIEAYLDVEKYLDPETGIKAIEEAMHFVSILQQEISQINSKAALGTAAKLMILPLTEENRVFLNQKITRFATLTAQINEMSPLFPVLLDGITGLKRHLKENLTSGKSILETLETREASIRASQAIFVVDLIKMGEMKVEISAHLEGSTN